MRERETASECECVRERETASECEFVRERERERLRVSVSV